MSSSDHSQDALFPGSGEVARLMRTRDWTATPVGAPSTWPSTLRTTVRLMLTSRFSMWMAWGPELTFFYNDAYREMTLGQKHPGALGARSDEVWMEIWPEIGPRIQSVFDGSGATWDQGLQLFLERSGYSEETYHTFSYSPLHDHEGVIRGMLCVVVEETERLIAERRLALLRDLAAALATTTTTPEVLAAVERCLTEAPRDLPFTLTYLIDELDGSAHLASTTGISPEHPAVQLVLDRRSPGAPWGLWEVGGETSRIDLRLLPLAWPSGPWARPPTEALVLRIPHPGQQDRLAGVFVAALNPHRPMDAAYRDFVGLLVGQLSAGLANARAHENERQRAETLAELDRAKTLFFSNISHEFRTPLTLMLAPLAELVGDPDLPAPALGELARIQRNGQRMLKLVNTMLDFSRIEAGRMRARYEPVDLSRLTACLAGAFQSATDKAGIELVIDCPPLGEPVYVDRDMWEKIVLNLISNAFKFTLEGRIAVSIGWIGLDVVLTVEDTGVGIPAHEIPRLFERFHRVEGSRGRSYEGTGIGLALVQELVKLHGGRITVESEVDRGTTVRVALPPMTVRPLTEASGVTGSPPDPDRSVAFVEEALRWLPSATPIDQPPADSGLPRILVVDDNADMRDYVGGMLAYRWSVQAVTNGKEAMEAARLCRPDLVVTDVMMPEVDGFGLLRDLRQDEALSDVPVLMLSARAGEGSRVEGLQAGASDYLVKPFSARELVARVETLLAQSRIRAAEDAQARRMAAVFRHAPVAIALVRGTEHVFELANPAYLELVGGTPVVGKPIREALPELDRGGVAALLDEVLATGRPFIGKTHPVMLRRTPEGPAEERFFDFVYQPIDASSSVGDIAIVAFEVTDLVKARRDAEVANRAKDEFLAMLGHELRNPLAPISTALEMMRLRGDDFAPRERATIERQVRHMVGLVDDLLDVSRIATGKVRLVPRRLEIAEVVDRAVAQVSDMFEQRRHTLKIDVPRSGLTVDGDEGRLEQVFTNLLTNAAKYTPPSGRITVTGSGGPDTIRIAVRDDGVGIAPDMLEQIFEPFAQSGQSLDRAQGGLGLGLAIVRNLVRLHGGSVVASSRGMGHGTTFTVELPRSAASPEPATPAPGSSPRAPRRGIRVLVVDDNEDGAEMLCQLLEAMGYQARCAFDGPAALTLAESFCPDIAVLDLGLPVMDGFELARRMRSRGKHAAMPLVALTGYGQETDRRRSAAAGFAAHLVKPVDIERLADTLRTLEPQATINPDPAG